MSTSPPSPQILPPSVAVALIHTSGSLIVGYLLAWGLYGVLAVQVYIYFLAFPRDRAIHKWLVAIVFLLETIQVVVIARDMFDAFAKGFGNPDAITGLHLDGLSAPIIAGFVGLLVQLFYAYRIKILSHSNVVPLLICFLAFIQCVGAFISGIRGFIGKDVRKLDTMVDRVGHGLFNATSAACDLVIAIAMSYWLPKLDSGIRDSTHMLVRRIVRLVVGTGALTAAVAVIDQALFEGFPHKGYFLAPAFVIGKLYSNSMMVIFNSRLDLRPFREETTLTLSTDIHIAPGNIGRFPVRTTYHTETRSDARSMMGFDLDIRPQKGNSSDLGHT